MRCINCQSLSFAVVCKKCKATLLKESISRRNIDGLEVVSLFGYSEIEPLILSKYNSLGHRIYKYFAENSLKRFLKIFGDSLKEHIYLIAIDDKVNNAGFSHTAILAHYSKSQYIVPIHKALLATSRVSYAKMSKEFRESNPRKFGYRGLNSIDVILLDDVITTGTTIKEAKNVLDKHGVNTLFAITLADATKINILPNIIFGITILKAQKGDLKGKKN